MKSAKNSYWSNAGNQIAIIIIVCFHVFEIEGVAKAIEARWEGVMIEGDHKSDSINGSIFINPDATNMWWD
jgi:coenzyme F420-reducing hydrogenase delta subunit